MRALPVLLILLSLTACGDGRWAPGYIIAGDGQMLANNDVNIRASTEATIVSELAKDLGSHWRVEAAIAELPVYDTHTQDRRVDSNGWMWPKATATITLIGDGSAEPPLPDLQITSAVHDYLRSKVEKPQQNLSVTTVRVVDPVRFAAKPATTATTPAAAGDKAVEKPQLPTPSTATRHYTAQSGDTWADLSLAFYGSAQYWRHLADANQGGELTTGREIIIPPKP